MDPNVIQTFLFITSFCLFSICMDAGMLLREHTFKIRIENDEWKVKHGWTKGILGWKRPKSK